MKIRNFLLIVAILQLAASFISCEEETKVLVDHGGNYVHPRPSYSVKPTSRPVEHEPGVPHDSKPAKKPLSRPINPNPLNWFSSLFNGQAQHTQGHKIPDFVTGFNHSTDSTTVEPIYNLNDTEIFDDVNFTAVESQPLILRPASNLTYSLLGNSGQVQNQEPNKGVVDWVLGLVGIQTGGNNNNPPTKPPNKPVEPKLCGDCACGVTFKQTRIVGGVETQVNAYPWMTILSYNGRFYCGASVINNKYLLTATHCVNGFTKERLQAVFLDHDRSNQFETKTFTRKIAAILKHRGYNMGGSYNNDIALLRLDEELPFSGLLRPVCLPTIGKSYTGYTGIATGWGATEEHGQVSNKLMEVDVPILSNIDCRKTGYGGKITDNMMCAGYKHGTKDSCQGDSGGPLHIVNSTYHTIVGIVSWGEGCAEPNYPGVYTRVNRYISWIRSNTKDACYCS
ncbi:PREDICTED: trypsin-1-like [Nicrophorus vespilloides]|uniref:Trypsin-1-like n=1 Tax=Nicrophorus vespilloides TaxID=110193 RepID=A0ABM1MQ06_NICVS|nr:PREDICTED: trypsin-1-like [Nicrophorus vespilloides]XP_017776655.1 PREDICTED: trypsin-1-like [Nicrophorus vespilloides]XP_017776656.1 PREDICTED: trypsin-1-like [Nicrophorus vespilloides]